jgi:hypothetical protein
MSRFFRALVIVLLAASCGGGGGTSAPRNLDNACSILQQRPGYLRAFRAAERKWGVPVHVQMAAMYQESKFKSDARTPFRYTLGVIPMGRQSSAYGYSQALNGTWEEYKTDQRKFRAKRNNINDAADFMGWYMSESNRRLGISLSDARNQYLAYHEGRSGFSRGTYNRKAWLLRVSDEIAARSVMYQGQLASCRVRR